MRECRTHCPTCIVPQSTALVSQSCHRIILRSIIGLCTLEGDQSSLNCCGGQTTRSSIEHTWTAVDTAGDVRVWFAEEWWWLQGLGQDGQDYYQSRCHCGISCVGSIVRVTEHTSVLSRRAEVRKSFAATACCNLHHMHLTV